MEFNAYTHIYIFLLGLCGDSFQRNFRRLNYFFYGFEWLGCRCALESFHRDDGSTPVCFRRTVIYVFFPRPTRFRHFCYDLRPKAIGKEEHTVTVTVHTVKIRKLLTSKKPIRNKRCGSNTGTAIVEYPLLSTTRPIVNINFPLPCVQFSSSQLNRVTTVRLSRQHRNRPKQRHNSQCGPYVRRRLYAKIVVLPSDKVQFFIIFLFRFIHTHGNAAIYTRLTCDSKDAVAGEAGAEPGRKRHGGEMVDGVKKKQK